MTRSSSESKKKLEFPGLVVGNSGASQSCALVHQNLSRRILNELTDLASATDSGRLSMFKPL